MKIIIAILFISTTHSSKAQDYIEWGSSNCGSAAITSKTTLIENGKSQNTLYRLSDRQSLKDSCSTNFIVKRLSEDSAIKTRNENSIQTKEIFKLASQLAALPVMPFTYRYCEVGYKISIGKREQEFNSRSGKTKKQKDIIEKIIRIIGQLNLKGR